MRDGKNKLFHPFLMFRWEIRRVGNLPAGYGEKSDALVCTFAGDGYFNLLKIIIACLFHAIK
jgi:hypothetical protein